METSIDTRCVQGGWKPKTGEPRVLPIVQSTTFKYDSGEHMGKLFALEASGYFYSRLQNPTCDTVAAKICELEGGAAAMEKAGDVMDEGKILIVNLAKGRIGEDNSRAGSNACEHHSAFGNEPSRRVGVRTWTILRLRR